MSLQIVAVHANLNFLSVLNRARPENEERERKTASGRTFRVQG